MRKFIYEYSIIFVILHICVLMLIFTQGPGNLKIHRSKTVETKTVMYSNIFTKDKHRKRGIDDIMI